MTRPGSHNSPVVVEPRREVVESRDESGAQVVLVAEAVPTSPGRTPVDTVGAVQGDILVVGPDGILRPRHAADVVAEHQRGAVTHYVDGLDQLPAGIRPGDYVIPIAGPDYGFVFRMEEGA